MGWGRFVTGLRRESIRYWGAYVLVIPTVVLVALSITTFVPVARIAENWTADIRLLTMAESQTDTDVVVVAIGEEDLRAFPYRSPVDRAFLAGVLQTIIDRKPRAIAIDILFDQPTEAAKDERLRQVLQASTVPVFVAHASEEERLTRDQAAYLRSYLPAAGLVRPAWANLASDRDDGITRAIFPGREENGAWLPGMAAALAQARGAPEKREMVPLMLRPFTEERPAGVRVMPAAALAVMPASWLADKLVLVGFDLPIEDRHRSQAIALYGADAGTIPGVVLHAHAVTQLISGRSPEYPGLAGKVGLLLAVAIAGALLARLDVALLWRLCLALAALGGYWGLSFVLSHTFLLVVPVLAPTLAFVASAGAVSGYLWREEKRQGAFLRTAFQRYVAPAIVNEIVRSPQSFRLGGEVREITYVFTDVAGFTAMTEREPPEVVVALVNEYLDKMCELFSRHQATIDKIVGDAVVGFFNAPISQPDHAAMAVGLALAIDDFAEDFRRRKKAEGVEFGVTRVGVHSGRATVGNFGGSHFFNYTGHGDTVNSASRLEGANKYLGTRLCISGATVALCPPTIAFRPMATLILKGKTKGIETFMPVTQAETQTDLFRRYCDAYRAMADNAPNVLDELCGLAEKYPYDTLTRFHLDRLRNGEAGVVIELKDK